MLVKKDLDRKIIFQRSLGRDTKKIDDFNGQIHLIDVFRILKLLIYIFTYKITKITQPGFTCPKLTIETLEQGLKYVQS